MTHFIAFFQTNMSDWNVYLFDQYERFGQQLILTILYLIVYLISLMAHFFGVIYKCDDWLCPNNGSHRIVLNDGTIKRLCDYHRN